jgi:hypothetical protein
VQISGARVDRIKTFKRRPSLTVRGLTPQKESLWIPTFSAELERPEVLVPRALRNVGGVHTPFLQSKEVFHGDVALFRAVKEVLTKLGWRV